MTDDPAPSILPRILLLCLLIFVNAFFAMSEIAVITFNDTKLSRMASAGNKRARRLLNLTKSPTRFLGTIQIGVTLAGFLASATAAQTFSERLRTVFLGVVPPNLQGFFDALSTVLITMAISFVSLVLGELVPKRIGMKYPERISLGVSGVLRLCALLFRPLVFAVSHSANGVLRLFGVDPHEVAETVTEEEIRMMVDQGGESGVIEDAQKEMINNIFEFDDTAVSEIMTHRTEIIGIEADAPLRDAVEASIKEGCSRLPVYEEDLDSVVGIVYVKDLLKYITCDLPAAETPRAVMRTPYFVPESMRCRELFKEMTTRRMQIAIVVDEYGGTAGLVTLEDILESIVGEIQDEYDDEEEDIAKINETTFLLDGATSLEEVEALTHVTLPEGEYETIAGFVLRELGYLPAADEIPPDVAFANLKFTIKEIKDKRLSSIQVEITPPV